MNNVKAPINLRHLVHGIIRNAQGEYENLQPVSRKIIIERLNLFSEMNPSNSPDWFALSNSIKSKLQQKTRKHQVNGRKIDKNISSSVAAVWTSHYTLEVRCISIFTVSVVSLQKRFDKRTARPAENTHPQTGRTRFRHEV